MSLHTRDQAKVSLPPLLHLSPLPSCSRCFLCLPHARLCKRLETEMEMEDVDGSVDARSSQPPSLTTIDSESLACILQSANVQSVRSFLSWSAQQGAHDMYVLLATSSYIEQSRL